MITTTTGKCIMCSKQLPMTFKGDCCSDKCRKAKSRLKSDFGKNAMLARHLLSSLNKAVELGLIDTAPERGEIEEIRAICDKLSDTFSREDSRQWNAKYSDSPAFTKSYHDD